MNIMIFNGWEAFNSISPLIKWKRVVVRYQTSGSSSCWTDWYEEYFDSIDEAQDFISHLYDETEHRRDLGDWACALRAELVLEF